MQPDLENNIVASNVSVSTRMLVAIATLAALIVSYFLSPTSISSLDEFAEICGSLNHMKLTGVANHLPWLALGIVLLYYAYKIRQHECYPWPGQWVWSATKTIHGTAARKRARNLVIASAAVLILLAAKMTYIWFESFPFLSSICNDLKQPPCVPTTTVTCASASSAPAATPARN